MSIDVAITADRNVIKKEAERILKHKNLTTNSAHVECESKSDTGNNRATGFRQYLSNLPGKGEIKELQTTAILGTAHCGKC
jgi:ABC-type sugar transport system substrate-binding protein